MITWSLLYTIFLHYQTSKVFQDAVTHIFF